MRDQIQLLFESLSQVFEAYLVTENPLALLIFNYIFNFFNLGLASRAEFPRLPEQPCWLCTSIALQQHTPLPRRFYPSETGWTQDAWLQWSYENWYISIMNFPPPWATMLYLHHGCSKAASPTPQPSENWLSSRCLTSVIVRELVFPSWISRLPEQPCWLYTLNVLQQHLPLPSRFYPPENWLSSRCLTLEKKMWSITWPLFQKLAWLTFQLLLA